MGNVGIVLMAAAVAGYGFFAAECVKDQLEILLLFRKMIYHLRNRILYANATLPEAILEVGERFRTEAGGIQEKPGTFFCRVSEFLEAERNLNISEAWKRGMDQVLKRTPLSLNDWKNLEAIGENLGYADRDMQERTLQFYLEQTDDTIENLKQEVRVRGKLYRTLGVACGIFLVILFA